MPVTAEGVGPPGREGATVAADRARATGVGVGRGGPPRALGTGDRRGGGPGEAPEAETEDGARVRPLHAGAVGPEKRGELGPPARTARPRVRTPGHLQVDCWGGSGPSLDLTLPDRSR